MSSIDTIDDVNQKSYTKVVQIYNAIRDMSDEDVENFVKTEGDINYRITEGSYKVPSLLHAALVRQHGGGTRPPKVPQLLLDHGADFTFKDNKGRTVVHKIVREQVANWHKLQAKRTFHEDYVDAILDAHVKFENTDNPCDENGFSHFHAACMTNNAVAVEFFLKKGVDVSLAVNSNSPYFPSFTPLQFAVKFTCPEVIEILLKYGANMYAKNAEGLTPLHTIVERTVSYCDITDEPRFAKTLDILIKFVIENGMDKVNANDDFGFSKLHVACLLEDLSLVESILSEVTNVNEAVNFDSPVCPGFTALHFAAFSNVHVFKLLLGKGADIQAKNEKGLTPFDFCLQNYTVEDIHSVLSSIQEWRDIILSDNNTKLLDVVSAMEDVDKFISFFDSITSAPSLFIPINSPLWPGYTLLHLAVVFTKKFSGSYSQEDDYFYRKEDTRIIEECLKRGADSTKADAQGSTPLHLAFYMKKRCSVQCILDRYDEIINPVDRGGLSHFHIACATRHLKGVEHFLCNKVDIEMPVFSNFYWCTRLKHINLKTGSRHITICPGSTPLHIAVACGDDFATKALLKKGADVHAKDANGFTPLHRLFACGDFRSNAYVQKSLLTVKQHLKDSTIDCGLSHLHIACFHNQCEAVEKLLVAGADAGARVEYEVASRVKDYDEFFCDEYRQYHEYFSFLKGFDGYTPLDFLWHRHRQEDFDIKSFWKITFMLINRCADVFDETDKGIPRLQSLVRYIDLHSPDCLYELLNKSTQTRLEGEFGVTKLHLACYLGDIKAVECAIKRGENVNGKVNSKSPVWQGFTPLHFIVKRAFEEYAKNKKILDEMKKMIKLLMKHGADPRLKDDNNETPFHVIKRPWYGTRSQSHQLEPAFGCVSTLFKFTEKFDVNPADDQGLSVFHIASATQNVDAVDQFLNRGVDVNRATSDFSTFSRRSTPLHLLMEYYTAMQKCSHVWDFCDKKFGQVASMLIRNGADVDGTDVFGKTLLFDAVGLDRSRKFMIEKLISNGANVYATCIRDNITPFELLLMQGNATWEEIELFLKAGYQLNGYSAKTQEGYMAQIFRYQKKDMLSVEKTMENPIFKRIFNDPKTIEIDDAGRTAIHNIVSIKHVRTSDDDVARRRVFYSRDRNARSHDVPDDFYEDFYAKIIKRLLDRGCDIDHEDNEGKTALHTAVIFDNKRTMVPLLKMGADFNLTDKNGKTPFAYCKEATGDGLQHYNPWSVEFRGVQKYQYHHLNYANRIFAVHAHKLEFCGQRVNNQNQRLQRDTLEILGLIGKNALDSFYQEVEKTKNMNIGNTSLSVYDFLTKPNVDVIYVNMTIEQRREMELFFENIDRHKFDEIDGLLRLKYRQIIERIKLFEPAIESLIVLIKFELPDLCCRCILKFLKIEDLKHLIAAVV